jgi:hypothetical protein
MLEQTGIVAHNSFVHSYAELGLFGGTAFLGLLYIPLTRLRRANFVPGDRQQSEKSAGSPGPTQSLPGFRFPIARRRDNDAPRQQLAHPRRAFTPLTIPGHFQISATDRRVTFSPDGPISARSSGTGSSGTGASGTGLSGAGELLRLRNCVLPVTCAYAIGLCSLSRGYVVSTYLILGIGAAYMGLARQHGMMAPLPQGVLLPRLAKASVGFLVCLYLFVVVVTR